MGIYNPPTPDSIGAVPNTRELIAGDNILVNGAGSATLINDVNIGSPLARKPWYWAPANPTDFTDVSGLVLTPNPDVGLSIVAGPPVSATVRYALRGAPGVNFSFAARICGFVSTQNYSGIGVIVKETGNKAIVCTLDNRNNIRLEAWTLPNTFGSLVGSIPLYGISNPFLMVQVTLPNTYSFYVSQDGVNYVLIANYTGWLADTNAFGYCNVYDRTTGLINLFSSDYFYKSF